MVIYTLIVILYTNEMRGIMGKVSLKKWQTRIFILCWVAYACIYFGRVNLSVAIPGIQNSLGLTKTQAGFIGSFFFWVYGIGQLINGCIGDRVSAKNFIFVGLFFTAAANLIFGFSGSIVIMLLLWAANGYFQSMLWGPMAKTLSYWFEYEKRNFIGILISTSMVGGYVISWGFSGQLVTHMNWRWAFWTPGALILVYSFIWYFSIKDHPEDIGFECPNKYVGAQSSSDGRNKTITLWQVIKETKLWLIVIACFAQGIIKENIGLWGPCLMMELHHIDIKDTVGFIMLIPFMNFLGMMFAGWLNSRLKHREKLTTIILFVLGTIMLFGMLKLNKYGAVLGLFFLSLSSAMMYGANTMLLGVLPMNFSKYNKVSSVAGFLDFSSYAAAGCAASLTGLIVDTSGWDGVVVFWTVITLLGIVSLLISIREDKNIKTIDM